MSVNFIDKLRGTEFAILGEYLNDLHKSYDVIHTSHFTLFKMHKLHGKDFFDSLLDQYSHKEK
jgi:hypothetical protein